MLALPVCPSKVALSSNTYVAPCLSAEPLTARLARVAPVLVTEGRDRLRYGVHDHSYVIPNTAGTDEFETLTV